MPFLKDYKHDIFISYCHSDNEKQFDEPEGWIENFYNNLEVCLLKLTGKKNVTIWWDEERLKGNSYFDDSIATALKNSGIMICLNSPSYLNSDYCKLERELFYNNAKDNRGIKVGDQSRILNVLLYNIPFQEWPNEFSGTSGFAFHRSLEKDKRGFPFEMNSPEFKETFLSFCDTIVQLLQGFDTKPMAPDITPPLFDIFFGDVSDNLQSLRKKTVTELKKNNFTIISDIPPPFKKAEHVDLVNKKLEKAEISVHLLDKVPGRNIDGEESEWYPQKQAELSLLTSKEKLIWVPSDLDIEKIEEEKYKTFLQGLENGTFPATGINFIRGLRSEVAKQVIDKANKVKENWCGLQDGKVSVLIDTHFNDQLYVSELYDNLVKNDIQPFINSQEGDPQKNVNILEDRIRHVSKLIFFYGRISREWVMERMKAAIQLVVQNGYPIKDFFVLMLPPHKEADLLPIKQNAVKINVINNSDALHLDVNSLQQFFNSIKAVS
jgi:hypothetical protein